MINSNWRRYNGATGGGQSNANIPLFFEKMME